MKEKVMDFRIRNKKGKKVFVWIGMSGMILLFLLVGWNNIYKAYQNANGEIATSESDSREVKMFQPSIGDYFTKDIGKFESEYSDWLRAAESGNEWAQCRMGDYYYTMGLSLHDHCEGLEWWLASAEQGNVIAKYRLIRYYFIESFEQWCRPHPFLYGLFF